MILLSGSPRKKMGLHGEKKISDRGGIRIHDLRIRSPLLHQLSYKVGWELVVGNCLFNVFFRKVFVKIFLIGIVCFAYKFVNEKKKCCPKLKEIRRNK